MKRFVLAGALVAALGAASAGSAQTSNTSLGTVTISKRVLADGKPLTPGTYQVRLTGESPKPGVGQSPDAERYVEFVRGGKVIAREVATVVLNADIATVAKGRKPAAGASRVETLKGNDYVRVWINRGGNHYIINLPAAT